MITSLVILYCFIGGIFAHGIQKEHKADQTNDLKDFSPSFVKVCIIAASLCWPLLVAVAVYQKLTKGE